MYRVELYAQVRRSVFVEGLSEREAAKRFGLARGTVRKMLRYATPPGYRRRQPAQRPKLDPFTGIVDQILIDDQERPKKQRHTAKRIFDRLRDEYDFTGGWRWCMNRNWPATNPTHRSITYQERTTMAIPSSAIRLRV